MRLLASSLLLLAGTAVLVTAAPAPLRSDINTYVRRDNAGVDVADGFKRDIETGDGVNVADGFKRDVGSGYWLGVIGSVKRDVEKGDGIDVADGF